MTLCVIFPPDGEPILHLPPAPDGTLRYIEAWPGSVIQELEPDGQLRLHGFVRGVTGGLPPGQFGLLFVVPADEVEAFRARHAPDLARMRRHHAQQRARAEQTR